MGTLLDRATRRSLGVDRDGEWTTVWLERDLDPLGPDSRRRPFSRGRLVDELDSLPDPVISNT